MAGLPSFSQTKLPGNQGFATIKAILDRSCSPCHDWTASSQTIVEGGRVVDKDPTKSLLYTKVADDSMPALGDKLTAEEKAFIRAWILAGAPSTDQPIQIPTEEARAGGAPAAKPAAAGLSAYQGKVIFHAMTGFTSTALFAAAGAIGAVHYIQMKDVAHPGGVGDDGGVGDGAGDAGVSARIAQIWGTQQTGRWWHVGLVVSGETLYLGDAITGLSMLTKHAPGKLTKADIHRYAFFTHATLMAAQIALGFLETGALARGAHDELNTYLGAHAVIGVAIPAIMLYAGLENILR